MRELFKSARPYFLGEIPRLIGDEVFERLFADNTPVTIEAIGTIKDKYYPFLSSFFDSVGNLIGYEKYSRTRELRSRNYILPENMQYLGEILRVIVISGLLASLPAVALLVLHPNLFSYFLGVESNPTIFKNILEVIEKTSGIKLNDIIKQTDTQLLEDLLKNIPESVEKTSGIRVNDIIKQTDTQLFKSLLKNIPKIIEKTLGIRLNDIIKQNDTQLFEDSLKVYALSIPGSLLCEIFVESLGSLDAENIIPSINFTNMCTKLFFSYALFYGSFGLPELQTSGLIWAMVISTYITLAHLIFKLKRHAEFRKIDFFRLQLPNFTHSFNTIKRMLVISWPIVLSDAVVLCMEPWRIAIFKDMNLDQYHIYKNFKHFESWSSIFLSPIRSAASNRLTKYCNNETNGLINRKITSRDNYLGYISSNVLFLVFCFLALWRFRPYNSENTNTPELTSIFSLVLINGVFAKVNELSIAHSQAILSTQAQRLISIAKLVITLYLTEIFVKNSQESIWGLYIASILPNIFFGRFQYRLFQFSSEQISQDNKELKNSSFLRKVGIYARLAFFDLDGELNRINSMRR